MKNQSKKMTIKEVLRAVHPLENEEAKLFEKKQTNTAYYQDLQKKIKKWRILYHYIYFKKHLKDVIKSIKDTGLSVKQLLIFIVRIKLT